MSTDGDSGQVPEASPAAVDLAYGIALSAYALAQDRWESVHRRIDTLLSFVTTATIAAPVAAEATLDGRPDFSSPLLISAGAVYLVVVVIALVARSFGSIVQISPRELHDQWLDLDETEFMRGILDWLGRHNERARKLTARKILPRAGCHYSS